ncbi:PQQ-binding-like beta-propeller repeat protein [Acidithiobacillus sp. CV18-2]|uniref:PQQ-binding-like beta-propeller repeat protein n=1 Tax=Igneacidithiobacillus copahuensis TaxID=2724909 RepID=A0AAE2YS57_9PROT|nr:PQQ-binding-like beta-propeller repeat protein [Igneacidithiobacillus copahuensis]MBU2754211.1 PQQ-binding-like beta-propeller repeat protein [Acidithiobacillus sp. CV18-3]MBU2756046.1 PQQ-binding-like beta-propeller repeat protein [Acidithiobacillus sp. BN09-2]MBU2776314.1 PQQ-binding-like beta-propeller repeat protein [Acidithiobacillus sp. CV18-2]MBU2797664.1 PQQ-binding-like beta-propeller repeat protein [Acidithiobacillus sp. VAN18-2]MBU2799223.1 PQQ-binding-like beta-propeller repeat 
MNAKQIYVAVAIAAWTPAGAFAGTIPLDPTHNAMDPQSPFATLYLPQNAPIQVDQVGPDSWTHAYGNPDHNAAFPIAKNAPEWIRQGVRWNFPEARAWPLNDDHPYGEKVDGLKEALPVQTQFYGNALGVSVVRGVVYAESDDMFAYAINAKTGKLIWRTSPVANTLMGNPLVVGNRVFLSAGSVSFNFANVMEYKRNPEKAGRGKDISYNGVFCLNRKTGKLEWSFKTAGDAMPTPAYADHSLFISTGDGNIYRISSANGKEDWKTHVGGIANMSSPVVMDGRVYVSMSVIPGLYSLDIHSGKVIWKGEIPGAVNTGMGDVSPAAADGIVVMDTVANAKVVDGKPTMETIVRAFNGKTGQVLWTDNLGRGPKIPAFKGGVPMIHDNMVYVGSPVTSDYAAIDLHTGQVKWTWKVPNPGPAGAGRGAPTYYQGTLYISTGPDIYAVNPDNGHLIHSYHVGGRFGIVNPTIVGGTMYLGNSWDWVNAVPVKDVNPQFS